MNWHSYYHPLSSINKCCWSTQNDLLIINIPSLEGENGYNLLNFLFLYFKNILKKIKVFLFFIYFKLIFFKYFYIILIYWYQKNNLKKIKKYYFNIFLNKKYFKNNYYHNIIQVFLYTLDELWKQNIFIFGATSRANHG